MVHRPFVPCENSNQLLWGDPIGKTYPFGAPHQWHCYIRKLGVETSRGCRYSLGTESPCTIYTLIHICNLLNENIFQFMWTGLSKQSWTSTVLVVSMWWMRCVWWLSAATSSTGAFRQTDISQPNFSIKITLLLLGNVSVQYLFLCDEFCRHSC